MSEERIKLKVKYEDKDLAKSLGAKWDKENGCWYADGFSQLNKIQKWFPQKTVTVTKKIGMTEDELYWNFSGLTSRFKHGKEILSYLRIDKSEIKKASFFCLMCDSQCHDEWGVNVPIGGVCELRHWWDRGNDRDRCYLTLKEKIILLIFLEQECC